MRFPSLCSVCILFFYVVVVVCQDTDPPPIYDDPAAANDTTTESTTVDIPTDPALPDDTTTESTTIDIPIDPALPDDTTTESTTVDIPTDPALPDDTTTESTTVSITTEPTSVDDTSTDATTDSTSTVETTTVVHGNWGEWGSYTTCSVACGTGNRYRTRSCDNPAPSENGDNCPGSSEEATSCTAGECCAPKVFDMVYLIDPTEYSSYLSYVRTLFKNVTGLFSVSPSSTRISIVTISSPPELKLAFNNYTDVESVINGISKQYSSSDPKAALEFVRSDVLTEQNGARSDVADAVIMTVAKSYYSYSYSFSSLIDDDPRPAAQKLKDNGVYLIVGEGRSETEFVGIADVRESYSYFYSSVMSRFRQTIADGFPCNYFCGTSVFALDSPSNLASGNDTSSGYLYLMTDTPYQMTCCGATSTWEFFAVNYGILEVMIFRNTGLNKYYLVGSTRIVIPVEYVNTTVSYNLIAAERVALVEGDVIGWHSPGPNIIGHADCSTVTTSSSYRADCPQGNKMMQKSRDTFVDGDTLDFSNATTVPNRGYSLKLATTNRPDAPVGLIKCGSPDLRIGIQSGAYCLVLDPSVWSTISFYDTELTIIAVQNETELEENTPIGYKAMYFRVSDTDLGDNFTMTLSGDSSLFAISDVQYEQVHLTLRQKLPSGPSGPYIITIIGQDSCQHTASTTVTVSTYNAPPIVNNLPHIMEISEDIKEPIFLYRINVTDATNDPVCCTLSGTLPFTSNFDFKNDSKEIWTSFNPAFSYGDNDAYRIFICCQDPYGSTTSYLILRLIETKEESTYIPPDWFSRAIAVSMVPISIMTILTFVTLVITMFCLDPPHQVESEEEEECTGQDAVTYENGHSSPESGIGTEIGDSLTMSSEIDEAQTDVKSKSKGESIYFRNLYTDEEIYIPVWRSRRGNKVSDKPPDVRQSKWHESVSKTIDRIPKIDDLRPRNLRPKSRLEFGVEMKMFHYGHKTSSLKPEQERSIEILQKKNEIRDKWQETIAKAAMMKKQKELRSKSGKSIVDKNLENETELLQEGQCDPNRRTSDLLSTNNSIENDTADLNMEKKEESLVCIKRERSVETFSISEQNDDLKSHINTENIVEDEIEGNLVGGIQENEGNLVEGIQKNEGNVVEGIQGSEGNEGIEESEENILSVFNVIVESGVAALDTNRNPTVK